MRVSGNAVRLAALVAAATASGYLWRAALEAPRRTTIIRVAPRATPPHVEVVAAAHDPVTSAGAATPHSQRPAAGSHRARRPTQVIRRVAAPASTATFVPSSRPSAAPSPPPKPRSKPKPAPKPSPQPSTPPAQSEPPPAAAPAAPPAPAPSPPPADPQESSSKPGWGNGDKNHDHNGPPGDDHDK